MIGVCLALLASVPDDKHAGFVSGAVSWSLVVLFACLIASSFATLRELRVTTVIRGLQQEATYIALAIAGLGVSVLTLFLGHPWADRWIPLAGGIAFLHLRHTSLTLREHQREDDERQSPWRT